MPSTPERSTISLSSTPRGFRSTSSVSESYTWPFKPGIRPRTATLSRTTADSWHGQLKKPQYISTVRERVTVSDRPWKSYSKILSMQPLTSTAVDLARAMQDPRSATPSECSELSAAFPSQGTKWSLFKKQRESTQCNESAADVPLNDSDSSAQPNRNYLAKDDLWPNRTAETPAQLQQAHWAGEGSNRESHTVNQSQKSPRSPDTTQPVKTRSPQSSIQVVDVDTERADIERRAAELRAAKKPEKRVIQYDLPNQQSIVVADQAAQATRESVVLVALHARQKRERDDIRGRLLSLYWKEGAISEERKQDARRALDTDDFESAQVLIGEAEAALKQAARARALEEIATFTLKPLAPAWTSRLERWKTGQAKRVSLQVSSKVLDASCSSSGGDMHSEAAASDESDKASVSQEKGGSVNSTFAELRSVRSDGAQTAHAMPESAKSSLSEQEERMKRLHLAMTLASERSAAADRSVPGSLQTEKISLQSKKLNEVPDVLLEKSTHVKCLSLRVNDLMSLPDKFCMRLLHLEEVDLGFNQLSSLPPTLGFLVNLCRLYVNENKLSGLPSSIGCLEKLQSLNLDKNNLCKLPPAMCKLSALTKLSLKNNRPFSLPPQEVVNKGWDDCRAFLSQVLEDGIAARAVLWDQIPALFGALDEKNEKRVDQQTFEHRMCWDLRFRISRKDLRKLWLILDEDGDGFISNHEFLYQLRRPVGD